MAISIVPLASAIFAVYKHLVDSQFSPGFFCEFFSQSDGIAFYYKVKVVIRVGWTEQQVRGQCHLPNRVAGSCSSRLQ